MVKVLRIGQSADLLPNLAMIENGRVSTTERVLVINDGLINQRWLKIQSSPPWKHWGIQRVLAMPTKHSHAFFKPIHFFYKKTLLHTILR